MIKIIESFDGLFIEYINYGKIIIDLFRQYSKLRQNIIQKSNMVSRIPYREIRLEKNKSLINRYKTIHIIYKLLNVLYTEKIIFINFKTLQRQKKKLYKL